MAVRPTAATRMTTYVAIVKIFLAGRVRGRRGKQSSSIRRNKKGRVRCLAKITAQLVYSTERERLTEQVD
jgi:hypothetical protein